MAAADSRPDSPAIPFAEIPDAFGFRYFTQFPNTLSNRVVKFAWAGRGVSTPFTLPFADNYQKGIWIDNEGATWNQDTHWRMRLKARMGGGSIGCHQDNSLVSRGVSLVPNAITVSTPHRSRPEPM